MRRKSREWYCHVVLTISSTCGELVCHTYYHYYSSSEKSNELIWHVVITIYSRCSEWAWIVVKTVSGQSKE